MAMAMAKKQNSHKWLWYIEMTKLNTNVVTFHVFHAAFSSLKFED